MLKPITTKYVYCALALLSFSCSQESQDNRIEHSATEQTPQVEESIELYRSYSISMDKIKEGIVKEMRFTDVDGSTRFEYKLLKSLTDSTFVNEEYDANFNLFSRAKVKILENSYVQFENYSLNSLGTWDELNLSKPLVFSFKPEDSVNISEFNYMYGEDQIIYQELLTRRKGFEKAVLWGDTIDCIRFELEITQNFQTNPSNTALLSAPVVTGYRLEAPEIGTFYHSLTTTEGQSKRELTRILTLEEFEALMGE